MSEEIVFTDGQPSSDGDPHGLLADELKRRLQVQDRGLLGLWLVGGRACAVELGEHDLVRVAFGALTGESALARALSLGVVDRCWWSGESIADLAPGVFSPESCVVGVERVHALLSQATPAAALSEWLARSGLLESDPSRVSGVPDPLAGLASDFGPATDPLAGLDGAVSAVSAPVVADEEADMADVDGGILPQYPSELRDCAPVAALPSGIRLGGDVRIDALAWPCGVHGLAYRATYLPTQTPVLVVEHAPPSLAARDADGVRLVVYDREAFDRSARAWREGVARLRSVRDPALARPRALRDDGQVLGVVCEVPAAMFDSPAFAFADAHDALRTAARLLSVLARAHLHGVAGFDLRPVALGGGSMVAGSAYLLRAGAADLPASSPGGFESLLGLGGISVRADLYGLGAALFEAVSGAPLPAIDRRCFPVDGVREGSISELLPDWSGEVLCALIECLVHPLPGRRPSSAVAILRRLRPLLQAPREPDRVALPTAPRRDGPAPALAPTPSATVPEQAAVRPVEREAPPSPTPVSPALPTAALPTAALPTAAPPTAAPPAAAPPAASPPVAARVAEPASMPPVSEPSGSASELLPPDGPAASSLPGASPPVAEPDPWPSPSDGSAAVPEPGPWGLPSSAESEPWPSPPGAWPSPPDASAPVPTAPVPDAWPSPPDVSAPVPDADIRVPPSPPGGESMSEGDIPSFRISSPDESPGDLHPFLQLEDESGGAVFDAPPSPALAQIARHELSSHIGPFAAMEVADLLERGVSTESFIERLAEGIAELEARSDFVSRLRAAAQREASLTGP